MPSVSLCLLVFGATCLCGCTYPFCGLFRSDHLWDTPLWCRCAWYTPFSASFNVVILALLVLCHPFGFLWFFASLHACLHVHAWVYVSSIPQSHGTMDTRSKPTFVLLGHPLLFDNMFICPVWHLLLACILACFPSICFFACLLACFFCHCMYTHGAWTLRAGVQPSRCKEKQ